MKSEITGLPVAPITASAADQKTKPRLLSVDALRGLVMVLMALDHTRDFLHAGASYFQPDDLTRTTAVLFFTRWITHFCAPVFMFTAGVGSFLWLQRGRRTKSELSKFLWTRGIWLIFLELTVIRFAFSFGSGPFLLLVFWALGCSMIVLGFLIWLPLRLLAVLSILVIALHNLADRVAASSFGSFSWMWNLLHQPGAFPVAEKLVIVGYPLIPWFAVMAAGFCFGPILGLDPLQRRKWMLRIGLVCTLAFLLIRGLNVYGDPVAWSAHAPSVLLSFLKCTKYPPSLAYLLMTIGPALLVMAWFEKLRFGPSNPLIIFGRVPLFYFIVHLYAIHLVAVLLAWLRYGHAEFMLYPVPSMGGPRPLYPADYGYPLAVVYLLWVAIVAALYPLCLWFARLKNRRRDWWLTYL